ncbi:hypothetical protein VNO80_16848 [Phaseolus coccineus]|uniref:Uncharacterized protein n=1 Tax=Phaseolus coccineus TaxID=3886 RepID=A0AAN9R8D5_PHACN
MTAIFFLFCLCAIVIISQGSAQTPSCGNSNGNYTVNSTYYNNLNTLLSSFSTHDQINYGFYNFSHGQGTDKAYATGVCRGDRTRDECLKCLNDSRASLSKDCPNQKEAIVWSGECTLRYSNRSIFGLMENQPTVELLYTLEVRGSVEQFNAALQSLMRNLTSTAASGDSRRKYATGSAPAPDFQTIYGYTQCTPDLSSEDCSKCLNEAISKIPECCSGKAGGNVLKPSCRIRFDPYIFYGPTLKLDPDAPPPSRFINNTSLDSQGKSNTSRTIIAIAVPVASAVLALSLFCIYLTVRTSRKKIEITSEKDSDDEDEVTFAESLQFNFETIRVATNEFADSNKVGQGGFGAVYRGRLSNGQTIAVKRLSSDSGQGDTEFKNEVLLLAKLQHRNLVRLIGFCLERRERLLIYEFVPNKSLDYFIFDPIKKTQLDWQMRYQTIRGIARGILYLHEDSQLRIIHRDLKASNILLDENMYPKISDFGMARLVQVDQTQANTHRVVGTYGYMAPEYAIYGQFSTKSDVFSYGVLVLEIVSGRKSIGSRQGEDLLSITWRNWKDGTIANIVDPTLINGSQNEIMRCIHIGLLCVQENMDARPTMTSVMLMLNSYSLTLPVPSEPAFVVDSSTRSFPNMLSLEHNSRETGSTESTNQSTQYSVDEASITETYPR